jgi:hypothetical protein
MPPEFYLRRVERLARILHQYGDDLTDCALGALRQLFWTALEDAVTYGATPDDVGRAYARGAAEAGRRRASRDWRGYRVR